MADTTDPKIHPLYARDKFPKHIKYQRAFYDAAVLATRIMDSRQALQHDYCFYFGINAPLHFPCRIRRDYENAVLPRKYLSDKGIGELDELDIEAVRAERIKLATRIRYEVDTTGGDCGWAQGQHPVDGIKGCDSIVRIDTNLYNAAKDKNRPPGEIARMTFLLANTMYHEVAHAAHHHLFGRSWDDFRELSLCIEADFEL